MLSLEELYEAAGAATPAKDLRRVASLLDGHEEKTVEQFISETKQHLINATLAKSPPKLHQERVIFHKAMLLQAGADQDDFRHAIDAIDKDKCVGKAEWQAIASAYRNAPTGGTHVYKFGSIKAARAKISDIFIERLESESKRGVIERITRWAS